MVKNLGFIRWVKQRFCQHVFAIEDLKQTGIPMPPEPTDPTLDEALAYDASLAQSDWYLKRVRWPCAKCGRVFFAHSGLDISPTHGPTFRRDPYIIN